MEFSDAVRARRMVRTYTGEPVDAATLTGLLAAATRAPSAGNTQGWDFLVLREPDDRDAFWAATTDPDATPDRWLTGMRTAPVLVLCLSDRDRYLDRYAEPDKGWTDRDPDRWPVPYWDVDVGMAAMILLLGAVDAGLAAAFFGVPPDHADAVHQALGIPPGRRIVGVVSVGHSAPDRRSPSLARGRRPLAEVVHDGRFGVPWA
ncbi:nitroreductase family protein [Spongisporangium articulatum]|uniref:Nitroreductase family protein n=1 Tax=Spongisporangium articulatum TaxID=3362603 RepID=A0ABW8ATN8_9ACTN